MNRLSQLSLLVLCAALPWTLRPQSPPAPNPLQRVFPDVGAGVRAVRRAADGRYFVLISPGSAVLVFNADEKKIGQVPANPQGEASLSFGTALDIDSSGRLYVADRGGNAVNVYLADGSLAAHVRVPAPLGIAALPRDEFAVSSATADNLMSIYDFHGTLLQAFGDLVNPTADAALNRRLNLGALASDALGDLYFAFEYLPSPTVRKYDRFGYLSDELSIEASEFDPVAQAAQRAIERYKGGRAMAPAEIITAIGVDPASQEMWLAFSDLLVHADRAGKELDTRRLETSSGIDLQPRFISVEPARLLLADDLRGIYALPRSPAAASQR